MKNQSVSHDIQRKHKRRKSETPCQREAQLFRDREKKCRLQYQNDVTTYIRSADRPQLQSNVTTFNLPSNATILNELDQDTLC
ncbi:7876_t:CDS:2 [Diversispora eburnea]|uniref:7876_t:CDS:1 n=1 Tax=Diversispora eburnea TaxID=1213867 RepID=A0A9N9D018_9GLOM|nr:7876_t:CDS:2 [Diversispora eburnea]